MGMHRSGTSALTRTLALAGGGLPATLFPPTPGDNDAGYWESSKVIDFHQWLLWHLNTGMLDPTLPDPAWFGSAEAIETSERLANLAESEWGDHPCWVIKEPRLCRLLPIWKRALASRRRRMVAVHCLREPPEVAGSLAARDGFPRDTAELLWCEHVVMAERDTRDLPRIFTTFDALLEDWRSVVGRVAALLPIGAIDARRGEAATTAFLKPSLRRHRAAISRSDDPVIRAVRDELFAAGGEGREPSAAIIDAAWNALAPRINLGAPRR